MVVGIESFREWFKGNEEQYVIIGGTACDILMAEEEMTFRATKDIDLVLIIEAVDADFGRKFWEYVKAAGYEHCNKSSGVPQFYRFSHPKSKQYPAMIELFTRKLDMIPLPDDLLRFAVFLIVGSSANGSRIGDFSLSHCSFGLNLNHFTSLFLHFISLCRFVKHIGQRTQEEKAKREVSWGSCWSGGCGQQAA